MLDKNNNTIFPGDYVMITCPFCGYKTRTFWERRWYMSKCPLCCKSYRTMFTDVEKDPD